jgi:peptide/nickel transport system permease protein
MIEAIRRSLGVDQPYWVQLWIFVKQVATGDFGASWSTNERVSQIFATRLGPSLTVLYRCLSSARFSPGGRDAGRLLRGSLTDRGDHDRLHRRPVGQHPGLHPRASVLARLPARLVSGAGWGTHLRENLLRYAALPILVGVIVSLAPDIRLYRSFFLDEIGQDYVRTARAKGLARDA